jgi:basic amino acid/polyamine antiporter, APA family
LQATKEPAPPPLVRAIGRWTLAALAINSVVGSGIFGLPDDIARLLGPAAPFAYLVAAAGMGVIIACFAEVGSQFSEAGGPYLYARRTFGRFAGVQVGWFAWLVRLTSAAANASLFASYLGEFWPPATTPLSRAALLALVLGVLAAVNVRGVGEGARLSNVFTAAKLAALSVFVVAGLWHVGGRIAVGASHAGPGNWMSAVLALAFAYGGFEAALMPTGEAKDPRRDTPFALFVALAVCAALYTAIQLVVMGALAEPGASDRPLADAARVFLGDVGARLVALAALVSTGGYLTGQFVAVPRLTYALAERHDFPALFARVHRRFRTPYFSILVYAALVWALAVHGSFLWNVILAAMARLITYGVVCAALVRLRATRPRDDAFRLPFGRLFAYSGMAFCLVLATQMNAEHVRIILAVAALGAATWLLSGRAVDRAVAS